MPQLGGGHSTHPSLRGWDPSAFPIPPFPLPIPSQLLPPQPCHRISVSPVRRLRFIRTPSGKCGPPTSSSCLLSERPHTKEPQQRRKSQNSSKTPTKGTEQGEGSERSRQGWARGVPQPRSWLQRCWEGGDGAGIAGISARTVWIDELGEVLMPWRGPKIQGVSVSWVGSQCPEG